MTIRFSLQIAILLLVQGLLFVLSAPLCAQHLPRPQLAPVLPKPQRLQRFGHTDRLARLAKAEPRSAAAVPGISPNTSMSAQAGLPVQNWVGSVRIKDVTSVEGHRANRVTGIGLVSGLKGTGGKSALTKDLGRNMLRNFDILARDVPTGSLAVVAVTAEIPPFVRAGETVTATVSVFDDTSGLYGGELHSTSLKGFDGQVYAVAGGALTLGGFSAGGDGGSVSKNHDTTGRVQARVEVGIQEGPAFPQNGFRLLLDNKDYATAYRIATEINRYFPGHARARDQGSVDIAFPRSFHNTKLDFVVMINNLRVTPDMPARVVINQKTGTIVVGQNVRLSKVMFANDNLIITTSESPVASQPAPFSDGQTVVLPRTQITATETGGRYNLINQQATVGDLATALNTLGVSPQDLIGIFQSIQASGALQAKLIIE